MLRKKISIKKGMQSYWDVIHFLNFLNQLWILYFRSKYCRLFYMMLIFIQELFVLKIFRMYDCIKFDRIPIKSRMTYIWTEKRKQSKWHLITCSNTYKTDLYWFTYMRSTWYKTTLTPPTLNWKSYVDVKQGQNRES